MTIRLMFKVTYDIVTEESAEHGDVDSHGFLMPGMWHYPCDPITDKFPDADTSVYCMTIREARRLCDGGLEDNGSWFSCIDSDIDYHTGAQEFRALHPWGKITSASYARLRRVFGVRSC